MKLFRKVVGEIKDLKVNLSIEGFNMEDYGDYEFAIAKVDFLSTNQNTHKLDISEEVLREYAQTVLRKWLVAEYDDFYEDVTTHTNNQQIFGMFPFEQEIEFREEDGIVIASAMAVISKVYSTKLYNLFKDEDITKDVSVEMRVSGEELENGHIDVSSFNIVGVTVLGRALGKEIHGSCPDAYMNMVRFSDEEANKFYANHYDSLAELQRFSKERRTKMADTKYKINTTELKETPWGDVDKTEMRNKIMQSSNKATLVKSVYMLVEDGWEDAPSEHLKYPVMELVGDTFYYNRYGLASALAYAKQEGEDGVVAKIEKIYDKFDLDKEEEKENMAMKEIEFAAVDLNDMWSKVYSALSKKAGYRFYIVGLYEEDNKKFAIIKDDDMNTYRVDYSYTEEGLTLADEYQRVAVDFVPTENMVKFAEPDDAEKYMKLSDDEEDKDDDDDDDIDEKEEELAQALAKCDELEKQLEEKDNIIMDKDALIKELEEFKSSVEDKEKMECIDSVMEQVSEYLDNDQYKEFKDEGMACELSSLDNWTNKVKAFCFAKMSEDSSVKPFRYTNFSVKEQTEGKVWDRL